MSYIHFRNDTNDEIAMVKSFSMKNGAFQAVLCDNWRYGGAGGVDLADAVIEACNNKNQFKFLYSLDTSIEEKIATIAKNMYGAGDVKYSDNVLLKIKNYKAQVI